MNFHDLNEHVVFEILSWCDIYNVLSFACVNKYYRHIALSKQLWLVLVRDLEYPGLIDVLPGDGLEDRSAADLMDQVKRIVLGPKTWSPAWDSPATVKHEITVLFEKPYSQEARVSLLPGGRYFVFCDWLDFRADSIQVWHTATGRCIWKFQRILIDYVVDVADGGDVVCFLFICEDFNPDRTVTVKIVRLDLLTRNSTHMFDLLLPNNFFNFTATISGDFFALSFLVAGLESRGTIHPFLIVNWRSKTYAFLEPPGSFRSSPRLIPGHIITTCYAQLTASSAPNLILAVYSLASLLWTPIDTHKIALYPLVSWSEVTPVITECLPVSWDTRLDVFQSPIHRDTYKVTVYGTIWVVPPAQTPEKKTRFTLSFLRDILPPKQPPASASGNRRMIVSYNLSTAAQPPTIHFVSAVPAVDFIRVWLITFTFAGYSHYHVHPSDTTTMLLDARFARDGRRSREVRRLDWHSGRFCEEKNMVPALPEWGIVQPLGAYSSAVPVLDERSLTISYYV